MPAHLQHKLAAILFTDMVGFTALMGADERATMKLVRKNIHLQKQLVKKYGGQWLKEMGDGTLASFPSALDAVRCAGAIQGQVKAEAYNLRIGIHLGEVLFGHKDVFGDGVNIAARIEAEAPVGGICISHAVYRNIKNQPGLELSFLEEKTLKNVQDPIRLYSVVVSPDFLTTPEGTRPSPFQFLSAPVAIGIFLVLAAGLIYLLWPNAQPPLVEARGGALSIAVLPFRNDSEQKESSQHICDGVMEAVLDHLSRLDDLRLISRQSVEQYRGSTKSIPEIAEELGVSFIIGGSVRRFRDQLKIYAQLLAAEEDQQLWSQRFDGEMADIFHFESRIAGIIADQLNAEVTAEEKGQIESIPTQNLLAYDYFLRGKENDSRYSFSKEERDIDQAIDYYETAIREDPGFGQAYAYKARALWTGFYSSTIFKQNLIDSVLTLCNQALDLNPNIAEAYFIRGQCYLERSQFQLYQKDLEKALQLNPNHVSALVSLGHTSFILESDYGAALQLLQRAAKIDRGEGLPAIYEYLGWFYLDIGMFEASEYYAREAIKLRQWGQALFWTYTHQGKYEQALEEAKRLLSLYPEEEYTLWYNAAAHMYLQDYSTSSQFFDRLLDQFRQKENFHELNKYRNRLGYVYWQLGDKTRAREEFDRSIAYLKEGNRLQRYHFRDNTAYNLAATNAFLGNNPAAYNWLKQLDAYGWHWGYPFHIDRDPMFDSLRDDPEFQEIVQRAQAEKLRVRRRIEQLEGALHEAQNFHSIRSRLQNEK